MEPKPYKAPKEAGNEGTALFKVEPFTDGDLRENVMDSGWRLFAELWDTEEPAELRKHAILFPNLELIEPVGEYHDAQLTFTVGSQRFAAIRSQGEYLFFVDSPNCDAAILLGVARHFNSLLRRIRPMPLSH